MTRKILVTSALTYANGAIHLGHLLEAIQTDIWVRFQKMRGHACHYICGDDTHGTSIMLSAEKAGVSPEVWIEQMNIAHQADFAGFHIGFDHYYSTHSPENKALVYRVYAALKADNKIARRHVEQLFDPDKNLFLSDRFVKGECPRCGARDQYGDACEACSATYNQTELKNPYSVLSHATPILKSSEHYFFRLRDCQDFLADWTRLGTLQVEAANKMQEWLSGTLTDWDISRDAPYFGFEIPDAPGKFFYVWLDAPIGYMASFEHFCTQQGLCFDEYWAPDASAELYHFIGKDILYFHALFWPAMLQFSGFRTPTAIFAHGYLTVDGQKMSKSRGTFITARHYLDQGLNPEWLRYYYAARLNSHIEDIDLNLEDLVARVNADLVGKYINIASRAAGFINKRFKGQLSADLGNVPLLSRLQNGAETVAQAFEVREYSHAIRLIMAFADEVNQYAEAHKPWQIAQQEGRDEELQQICSVLINAFRLLTLYLKPVLPELAVNVEAFLCIAPMVWSDAYTLLGQHTINPYQHLITRIDSKQAQMLIKKP